MKKSYQHIIKKSYTTPKIEEVEIDREMSLVMVTDPPIEPGENDDEIGDGDGVDTDSRSFSGVSGYQPANYKTTDSPFGDGPAY